MDYIKSPIDNYEKFAKEFSLLKTRLVKRNNILDAETYSLSQSLKAPIIIDFGINALNEIKQLFYSGNNVPLYALIEKDYKEFSAWMEELKKVNPIIKDEEPLSGSKILKYQENSGTEDALVILTYANVHNAFWSFYTPIMEVINYKSSEVDYQGSSFDRYFTVTKHINSIMPFLISKYSQASPKPICEMLFALYRIKIFLDPSQHKTNLYEDCQEVFKMTGTYSAFNKAINILNQPLNLRNEKKIEKIERELSNYLNG